jgi:hypothetical protein
MKGIGWVSPARLCLCCVSSLVANSTWATWNCDGTAGLGGCQPSTNLPSPPSVPLLTGSAAESRHPWHMASHAGGHRTAAACLKPPVAAEAGRDGKQTSTPSTAWKAREMRQQNKRAASEGQRAKDLVGTRLLPRQRRIDSPITARALHCCAPHCPSTAQFIGQFIFCQCCDAPSGLGRCSARRQRFGLFWFISQFRFAARE